MSRTIHYPYGVDCFLDDRGDGRSMRVRWHDVDRVYVISLWRGAECTATFRLPVDQVSSLVTSLSATLAASNDLQGQV